MTDDAENTLDAHDAATDNEMDDELDDDFDSVGDHHRAAARHFAAAARHHLLAATADDLGDDASADRHSYLAYRHRLGGQHCAEIAVMDSGRLDDVTDSER